MARRRKGTASAVCRTLLGAAVVGTCLWLASAQGPGFIHTQEHILRPRYEGQDDVQDVGDDRPITPADWKDRVRAVFKRDSLLEPLPGHYRSPQTTEPMQAWKQPQQQNVMFEAPRQQGFQDQQQLFQDPNGVVQQPLMNTGFPNQVLDVNPGFVGQSNNLLNFNQNNNGLVDQSMGGGVQAPAQIDLNAPQIQLQPQQIVDGQGQLQPQQIVDGQGQLQPLMVDGQGQPQLQPLQPMVDGQGQLPLQPMQPLVDGQGQLPLQQPYDHIYSPLDQNSQQGNAASVPPLQQ
eukprot:3090689-Rhodomonas_salina.4